MRRATCLLALGITVALLTPAAYGQRRRGRGGASNPADYCWLTDYNQAKRIARNNDQPLMVVFRCVP